MDVLISHLKPNPQIPISYRIAELSASIIAKICFSRFEQDLIVNAGALGPLVSCLEYHKMPKLQEAALDAISSLCCNNYPVVLTISQLECTFLYIF